MIEILLSSDVTPQQRPISMCIKLISIEMGQFLMDTLFIKIIYLEPCFFINIMIFIVYYMQIFAN